MLKKKHFKHRMYYVVTTVRLSNTLIALDLGKSTTKISMI